MKRKLLSIALSFSIVGAALAGCGSASATQNKEEAAVENIQEEEVEDAFWVDIDKVYDILTFDNLKEMWREAYNNYREVYNG